VVAQPLEIIAEHPAVATVAVIEVPDKERGEVLKAIIQLKSGYKPSEELKKEIMKWCKERLISFKVPRIVEFRSAHSLTPIGKAWGSLLREEEERKNARTTIESVTHYCFDSLTLLL